MAGLGSFFEKGLDVLEKEGTSALNNITDGAFSKITDAVTGGGDTDAYDGSGNKGILSPVILSQQKLKQLTPYLSGNAYIIFTKYPAFMNLLYPTQTKNFFNTIETFNIGIDGIGDDTLTLDSVEFGANIQTMDIATGIESGTDTITVNIPMELSGSPITRYGKAWNEGIIDKYTKVGHYYGQISGGHFPRWSNEYHTCEFIYIVTDKSTLNVEFAAYGKNVHLTAVAQGHYNFDKTDDTHKALSLAFKGQIITGDHTIMAIAKAKLAEISANRAVTLSQLKATALFT